MTAENRADAADGSHFDALSETVRFLSSANYLPVADERLPSAWAAHIPLMHCLMRYVQPRRFVELGSHHGTSFFSACRMVRDLPTKTQCIAIDNWQGDEHSARYSAETFEQFKRRLAASYADFASFFRCNFTEALGNFADDSIDLLHIDGYHTYEAVKQDFESWLPKMSDTGIMLLHDTCVRSGTFGVYRLLEELSKHYACFNLAHDHGLAIVPVGKAPTRVRKLVEAWAAEPGLAAVVVEFFKCAGFFNAHYAELENRMQARTQSLEQTLQQTLGQISEQQQAVEQAVAAIEEMKRSRCWRITGPLRAVGRLMRKIRRILQLV